MSGRPGIADARRAGVFVGLVVFMLVIAAVAALAWMILLPRVITSSASELTGFPTRLGSLHANPFTGAFHGESLVMSNPTEWGDDALAELGEVSGRVDIMSLRGKTAVVKDLTIQIDRLVIKVNADGRTNVEALGDRFSLVVPTEQIETPRYVTAGFFGGGEDPEAVLIERLVLRIGTIEIHDQGTSPESRITDEINYEHTYTDVRRYEQLITPQLLASLAKSPATLHVLLSSGLLGGAGGSDSGGIQQLFERAGGAVNSFLQGLEQTGKP